MTLDEIIAKLEQDGQSQRRFPARIIFAENFEDYAALTERLRGLCAPVLSLGNFCEGDTLPGWERLKARLQAELTAERRVLLLGVGEYLRLCLKWELKSGRPLLSPLWSMGPDRSFAGRIIMPLFAARGLFESAIGTIDTRQEDCLYSLDESNENRLFSLSVYSPKFAALRETDARTLGE